MCLWLYMTLEDCNLPTEPLAAMAAASSKTSTIPARTVAEFLLFASRWPRSCWITKCECWDWKTNNKKTEEIIDLSWKKKNTEKKKRVREKVTENFCIEVIRLIKWQTKNWILVIKCITPFAFFIQAQNEPQLWANRLKPKLKSVRTSWILKHISSLHH